MKCVHVSLCVQKFVHYFLLLSCLLFLFRIAFGAKLHRLVEIKMFIYQNRYKSVYHQFLNTLPSTKKQRIYIIGIGIIILLLVVVENADFYMILIPVARYITYIEFHLFFWNSSSNHSFSCGCFCMEENLVFISFELLMTCLLLFSFFQEEVIYIFFAFHSFRITKSL